MTGLERAFEASVMREYDGFKYRALEPTDNMLFLTYHMLKHLITNGISLRMLMDNALFSMKNASDIDRTRYASELSLTGYSRAVRLLFGTAARYFGIAEECFPIEPITDAQGTETFMTDLEEGGWEGYKNKANPGAWAWQYYRRENAGKAGRENGLSNMRGGGMYILRSAMFPGKYKMKAAYPVLKKHMILYPFCWAHRLLREGLPWLRRGGLKKVVPPSGSETRLSGEARERLELYRRLELIDGGK